MRRVLRSPISYVVLGVVVVIVIFALLSGGSHVATVSTGDYQKDLTSSQVLTATIHDGADKVTGQLVGGINYQVSYPDRYTPEITAQIAKAVPGYKTEHPHSNPWLVALENFGPILVLIGLFGFLFYSTQGGGRLAQFGKAKTKTASKDMPKVTFADVAGADEAVAELTEIRDFLEAPSRFESLGARIPKGVLLFGPPGTGKTLLARAVAGEAGVPFFSISGSDFVEMFVGVGASRVRDLFEQAKSSAPAIVFMDEIDAVGRHRGAGLGGGHDEREQTLNQLLVEMDGFDTRQGVILIAATNRPDILDPALLRPGRFDRQIVVDRPDRAGRRKILEVHADGKPLNPSVSLDVLAKRTPGFTGADLANLLNEAALLTARRNLRQIGMRECEEAIDRVMAGPERKTLVLSDHDKAVTAYHEAGHVIVGHVLPHADPIHKVSIVARSRSLGLTFTLPDDKFNHSRSELRDAMAMCLGGRSAEELVFDEPTTGAENDIEKATRLARSMVTEYGMSDTLGPQQLAHPSAEVFLGREMGHQTTFSQEIAGVVDAEVRDLIAEAHDRARRILLAHAGTLEVLARALMDKETLDTPELMDIIGELEPWSAPAPARSASAVARTPPVSPAPGVGGPHLGEVGDTEGPPAASPPRPPRPVRSPSGQGRRRRPAVSASARAASVKRSPSGPGALADGRAGGNAQAGGGTARAVTAKGRARAPGRAGEGGRPTTAPGATTARRSSSAAPAQGATAARRTSSAAPAQGATAARRSSSKPASRASAARDGRVGGGAKAPASRARRPRPGSKATSVSRSAAAKRPSVAGDTDSSAERVSRAAPSARAGSKQTPPSRSRRRAETPGP